MSLSGRSVQGFNMIPQQGTQDWLNFRRNGVGSSDAGIIHGDSKYCTAHELWKRKLGLVPEQETNSAMQRGKDLEKVVLQLLEDKELYFIPGMVVSSVYPWCFASLDGIDLSGDIAEIKCINRKDHEGTILGKVPKQYYAQLQHQIFCAETDGVLYVSYYPNHEEELVLLDVKRDEEYIKMLLEKEQRFYTCMTTKTWDWE